MRFYTLFLCCLLVSACGGGGSGSSSVTTPEPTNPGPTNPVPKNQSPVIQLENQVTIASGTVYSPSPVVSDPDGDKITYLWTSSDPLIRIDNPEVSRPTFRFPVDNQQRSYTLSIKATDAKGASTSDTIVVNVTGEPVVASAPVINPIANQAVESEQTIIIKPVVSDLDNDIESYRWTSSDPAVKFSDPNKLTSSITFPLVEHQKVLTLTLTVKDAKDNQVSRHITVTLSPKKAVEKIAPVLTIKRAQSGSSFDNITVMADIISTQALNAGHWKFNGETIAINTFTRLGDNRYQVKVSLTLPKVDTFTKLTLGLEVTTVQGGVGNDNISLFVSPIVTPSLSIVLNETISMDELSTKVINPNITHSHPIGKVQWKWLDETPISLNNMSVAAPTLSAPRVDRNIEARLQLSVHMGKIVKTVQTTVKVKNDLRLAPITLNQSRLVTARGQKVIFRVNSKELTQIKSATWTIIGLGEANKIEKTTSLELTIPQITSSGIVSVVYSAKLQDGATVLKTANFSILNDAAVKTSLTITPPAKYPIIENNKLHLMSILVLDQFKLIDSIEVTQPFTINTFKPIDIKSAAQFIQLALLTETIESDHIDFLNLKITVGDVIIDYPLQLTMKGN